MPAHPGPPLAPATGFHPPPPAAAPAIVPGKLLWPVNPPGSTQAPGTLPPAQTWPGTWILICPPPSVGKVIVEVEMPAGAPAAAAAVLAPQAPAAAAPRFQILFCQLPPAGAPAGAATAFTTMT